MSKNTTLGYTAGVTLALAAVVLTAPAQAIVSGHRPAEVFVQPKIGVPGTRNHLVRPSRTVRKEAALRLVQRRASRPFRVQWDPNTGNARTLAAGLSRPYRGRPESAARQFIQSAKSLLGPGAEDRNLRLGAVGRQAFGSRVVLQQQVNGVPVLGRQVVVNMTPAGEVILVDNTTAPVSSVNTTPAVSADMLRVRTGGRILGSPEKAIEAGPNGARLVWRYITRPAADRVLRVTVDAQSGHTLRSENLVQRFSTGSGNVYTGNPVSTPVLTSQPFPWMDGTGSLTGAYNKVYKYDATVPGEGVQDISESTLAYNYLAGDARLAQAEVYYAVNHIHDYFKDVLGYAGRDHQIPAWVGIPNYANAYFWSGLSENGGMAFGTSGGTDFALDADVIFHEYTHAVIDLLAPGLANAYPAPEQGGINEGSADYFSSTVLEDPILAEYVGGAYGRTGLRDLRNRYHFPEEMQMGGVAGSRSYQTYPEVHQTGEIWGPVAWDMRIVLGKEKADRILFDGISLMDANTTFQSALAALLTADAQRYNGSNRAKILEVFGARGITEDPYPVSHLTYDAFYSTGTGPDASKVRTGWPDADGDGTFQDYDDDRDFEGYGLFPSMVGDRWYVLVGYTRDPDVNSVFVVLKDTAGNVVSYAGNDAYSLTATTATGTKTLRRVSTWYQFPMSLIPAGSAGRTDLKVYVHSYTEAAGTVSANFAGTTPKAVAGGYAAQVIRPQVTPVINPPVVAFGDTDGNGVVDVRDALMVNRFLQGIETLTDEQKARADVAEPFNGNPDAADVKAILAAAGM